MSEPKNHHYIPQSYLRNFAFKQQGKQHLVYVRYKGEKYHPVSVRNICAENYFYSIPGAAAEDKNLIEKFYANNIDHLYPEITKIITDDSVKEIDIETRRKIVTAVVSLYFRTPKFLNLHREVMLESLSRLESYALGKSEVHTADFFGKTIDLKTVNFDELKQEVFEKSKIVFLKEHLEVMRKFIEYKINDGIGIVKLEEGYDFITCDNPVDIRHPLGVFRGIFDPANLIELPLTPKYKIALLPRVENDLTNTFSRIAGGLTESLTVNHTTEQNSDRWIIGSEQTVKGHVADQIKYNKETPENEKMLTDLQDNLPKMIEFLDFFQNQNNGQITPAVIDRMRKLQKEDFFKNDPNFLRLIEMVKEKGFEI